MAMTVGLDPADLAESVIDMVLVEVVGGLCVRTFFEVELIVGDKGE